MIYPSLMEQKGTGTNVGILGGGQLGCMLADAALALGLAPLIYAEASSPAVALFPDRVHQGIMADEERLRAFLGRVTCVAFENEFVDCDLLERVSRDLPLRFSPGLKTVRILQDKLNQKKLITHLGLPTSPFVTIFPGEEPRAAVDRAFAELGERAVFKWSRLGYDGKGVLLADTSTSPGREEVNRFCETALARGIPLYAERRVDFRRELAIVACRSRQGDFACYPLVISEQEKGICKRVSGPATEQGVKPALELQAREAALKIAEATGLEGCFAVELFETRAGEITINEIAPRVHNSGHYTQDACQASQFENHWRALLDLPLGDPRARGRFEMLNLLGPGGVALTLPQTRVPTDFPSVPEPLRLHWYAKAQVRPGRKVGHLNAVSKADLTSVLDQYHLEWVQSLQRLQAEKKERS